MTKRSTQQSSKRIKTSFYVKGCHTLIDYSSIHTQGGLFKSTYRLLSNLERSPKLSNGKKLAVI